MLQLIILCMLVLFQCVCKVAAVLTVKCMQINNNWNMYIIIDDLCCMQAMENISICAMLCTDGHGYEMFHGFHVKLQH